MLQLTLRGGQAYIKRRQSRWPGLRFTEFSILSRRGQVCRYTFRIERTAKAVTGRLTLFGLEARIGLVDYIDATFTTHHFAIPMALFEGFKG